MCARAFVFANQWPSRMIMIMMMKRNNIKFINHSSLTPDSQSRVPAATAAAAKQKKIRPSLAIDRATDLPTNKCKQIKCFSSIKSNLVPCLIIINPSRHINLPTIETKKNYSTFGQSPFSQKKMISTTTTTITITWKKNYFHPNKFNSIKK